MSAQLSIASNNKTNNTNKTSNKTNNSKGFVPETATLKQFEAALKRRVLSGTKQREQDQSLLVFAAIQWLKPSDSQTDTIGYHPDAAAQLLESFDQLSGSVKVENMVTWFSRVGLKISEHDGKRTFRKDKKFNFNRTPVEILREARKYAFYNLPSGSKAVKVPENCPKTQGKAVEFARYALYTGDIAGVKAAIEAMYKEVALEMNNPKVIQYVKDARSVAAKRPKGDATVVVGMNPEAAKVFGLI